MVRRDTKFESSGLEFWLRKRTRVLGRSIEWLAFSLQWALHDRVVQMRSWAVRLALLVATVSVWIGFQIGLERSWTAGIFLFLIPLILVVLSGWVWMRAQDRTNVAPQESAEVSRQIERLSSRLSQIERKLDEILNLLAAQAALGGIGGEKHDQQ